MNAFDKILWRTNGVLILLAAFAILFAAVASLLDLGFRVSRQAGPAGAVRVNEETQREERLQLGRFTRLEGLEWHTAPLHAAPEDVRGYLKSYKSYSSGPVRNRVFFHPERGAHWLFPGNTRNILEMREIYDDPNASGEHTVTGLLLVVIEADTNGDGEKTADDDQSLWAANADGTGARSVMEGIDDVMNIVQHGPDATLVFYFDEGEYAVARLDAALNLARTDPLALPE